MLYTMTIPAYRNALGALSAQLDKAETWGKENGTGEADLINARLAPDMFPLATQVRFSCGQATGGAARLGATGAPEFVDDADDFAGLRAQLAATLAWLDSITANTLSDDLTQMIAFNLPNGMVFDLSAADYVRDWALPQFYFHIIAAYAVMRHQGVPLGKADYAGYMMRHLRPGTMPAAD